MNMTRLFLSSVAGFVAYFICGGLVSGIFLKKDYISYTSVYRLAEEIMKLFPLGIARHRE
jgi:hypothetical protein